MLKMNKYSQLSKYTPEAKRMWATQMMFKPVQIIDSLVQNKKGTHQPKYLMYSSHDTQVGILWEWLNFTSFQFDSIPYASFLQMELYEDKNCNKD